LEIFEPGPNANRTESKYRQEAVGMFGFFTVTYINSEGSCII